MTQIRVLDLFSGIGGFSLGLESTGHFQTIGFCEIEPFPREVLRHHWPGVPIWSDIRDLSGDALRGVQPDLICGGFPCQDISVAGKGAGIEGSRSGLWAEMFRLVRELRPRWVLAENVPALRTRGSDRVLSDLEGEGYSCWPLVVGAWAVGAPHRRNRVWVVAHRDAARLEERPQSEDERGDIREEGPSVAPHGLGASWPARPGEHQHEWEEPRLAYGSEQSLRSPGQPRADADPRGPQLSLGLPVDELRRRLARRVVVVDGTTEASRPSEVLRFLQEDDDAEGLSERAGGGPPRIPRQALLRPRMHGKGSAGVRGKGVKSHPLEESSRRAAGGGLRGLRTDGTPEPSPRQRGQAGQPSIEHQDSLSVLPQERALEEAEATRLLRGFRRQNREALKALGNSVVPQVVAAIGCAILKAEKALTRDQNRATLNH